MKHLIKWSGIALALGINTWLIYDNFILIDVHYQHKLGFVALMILFVLFMIVWRYVSKKIDRKLQAIATANELGAVGQTSLWYATILDWIGIVVPITLVGGLFYYVGAYFNQVGGAILKMALVMVIPIGADLISKMMLRNEMIMKSQEQQQTLVKNVADEVTKRTVGYQ